MIINYKNLETIKKGHVSDTVEFASALADGLNYSKQDRKSLEIAAALHDIGKVMIPPEYLNKNGALNFSERHIVNLHASMGYDIMKALGYDIIIAEAVRDHHNPFSTNRLAQVLRMADIYSAMTEERPYKSARSHEEAMDVLSKSNFSEELLTVGNIILKKKREELNKKQKGKAA